MVSHNAIAKLTQTSGQFFATLIKLYYSIIFNKNIKLTYEMQII